MYIYILYIYIYIFIYLAAMSSAWNVYLKRQNSFKYTPSDETNGL